MAREAEIAARLRGNRGFGDILSMGGIPELREVGKRISERAYTQEEAIRELREARAKRDEKRGFDRGLLTETRGHTKEVLDELRGHKRGVLTEGRTYDEGQDELSHQRELEKIRARVLAQARGKKLSQKPPSDKQMEKAEGGTDNFRDAIKLETAFKTGYGSEGFKGGTIAGGITRFDPTGKVFGDIIPVPMRDTSPEGKAFNGKRERWWRMWDDLQAVERHSLYGAALTGTELGAWKMANIDRNSTDDDIRHALAIRKALIEEKRDYALNVGRTVYGHSDERLLNMYPDEEALIAGMKGPAEGDAEGDAGTVGDLPPLITQSSPPPGGALPQATGALAQPAPVTSPMTDAERAARVAALSPEKRAEYEQMISTKQAGTQP